MYRPSDRHKMSSSDLFRIEYELLSIRDVYGKQVASDYHPSIPLEYFVDANISFYLNGNKFFSDESFSIFKFVLDASDWFEHGFPNSEFVWNKDYFDSWLAIIAIIPTDNRVLFRVISEDEEDIEVSMAIDSFQTGFTRFLNGFKERAESFCGMSFDSI